MGDPLWSTAWRYAIGALVLAAAGAAGLVVAHRPLDGIGLLAGAVGPGLDRQGCGAGGGGEKGILAGDVSLLQEGDQGVFAIP